MHSIVDRGDQETVSHFLPTRGALSSADQGCQDWDNCQVRVFTFDTSDPIAVDPDMIELDSDGHAVSDSGTTSLTGSALRVDQLPGATGVITDE